MLQDLKRPLESPDHHDPSKKHKGQLLIPTSNSPTFFVQDSPPSPITTSSSPSNQQPLSLEINRVAFSSFKPYICQVPSCAKNYKKVNGLISHFFTLHHQLPEGPDDKRFKCGVLDCPKAYRNSNGLAYHIETAHADLLPVITSTTLSKPDYPLTDPSLLPPLIKPTKPIQELYRCPYVDCNRVYKTANGLSYHLSKGVKSGHKMQVLNSGGAFVAEGETQAVTCPFDGCGVVFDGTAVLTSHIHKEHASRPTSVASELEKYEQAQQDELEESEEEEEEVVEQGETAAYHVSISEEEKGKRLVDELNEIEVE